MQKTWIHTGLIYSIYGVYEACISLLKKEVMGAHTTSKYSLYYGAAFQVGSICLVRAILRESTEFLYYRKVTTLFSSEEGGRSQVMKSVLERPCTLVTLQYIP